MKLVLRPQEAADALGVSLRTIMEWVKAGEIPTVRLGERNLRFPLDGLRDWVAQRTTWPTAMTDTVENLAGDSGDGGPADA